MKNMKLNKLSILTVIVLLFVATTASAQKPDPFVNGAMLSQAPVVYGGPVDISFQFINTSPTTALSLFPPTTLTISLSDLQVVGTFNPSSVTGTVANYFTWTQSAGTITGTLTTPVPALVGGSISIANLKNTQPSDTSNAQAGFNVNVNATGSNNASTANDYTSVFTFTTGLAPLPLNWLDFNVFRVGDEVGHLVWNTASESDLRGYEVEFTNSLNKKFEKIGFAEAKNSTGKNTYKFDHNFSDFISNQAEKVLYYRIKQVELNGRYLYSAVKSIDLKAGQTDGYVVDVWPNPVTTATNSYILVKGLNIEHPLNYILYDANGRVLFNHKVVTDLDYDNYVLDMSSYSAGTYILNVKNGPSNIYQDKLIVK